MKEEWKPILGFEGYEISTLGRVKSLRKGNPKILKSHIVGAGYLKNELMQNDIPHLRYVHRLVAQAFIPNVDNKPEANHLDGDKTNNHVNNLEWVTHEENGQHGKVAKLNGIIIKTIREAMYCGWTRKDLAKHYNVTTVTIGNIVNRKTWKNII